MLVRTPEKAELISERISVLAEAEVSSEAVASGVSEVEACSTAVDKIEAKEAVSIVVPITGVEEADKSISEEA